MKQKTLTIGRIEDLTELREKMDSYRRIMDRAGASYLAEEDAERVIKKNERKARRVYEIFEHIFSR